MLNETHWTFHVYINILILYYCQLVPQWPKMPKKFHNFLQTFVDRDGTYDLFRGYACQFNIHSDPSCQCFFFFFLKKQMKPGISIANRKSSQTKVKIVPSCPRPLHRSSVNVTSGNSIWSIMADRDPQFCLTVINRKFLYHKLLFFKLWIVWINLLLPVSYLNFYYDINYSVENI